MEPENSSFPTPPPPKKNNLVVILLSILLLITFLISGYLFLQIQSLTKQLADLQVQPIPTPLSTEIPSPTPDPTANWKTYINSAFNFSVQYPSRFTASSIPSGDEFYKTVAKLSSNYGELININVINNIDVYQDSQVNDVAKREIMDSGYQYEVIPTKVNQYPAAITTVNDSHIQSVSITIQHPKKNLYIVLVLPKDISKVEFDQVLSTFEFTD